MPSQVRASRRCRARATPTDVDGPVPHTGRFLFGPPLCPQGEGKEGGTCPQGHVSTHISTDLEAVTVCLMTDAQWTEVRDQQTVASRHSSVDFTFCSLWPIALLKLLDVCVCLYIFKFCIIKSHRNSVDRQLSD